MDHLSQDQEYDILKELQKNSSMFDRTLMVYPHKKIQINVDPNAKPVYSRPYPVTWIHLSTFKKELEYLLDIGFLVHQNERSGLHITLL